MGPKHYQNNTKTPQKQRKYPKIIRLRRPEKTIGMKNHRIFFLSQKTIGIFSNHRNRYKTIKKLVFIPLKAIFFLGASRPLFFEDLGALRAPFPNESITITVQKPIITSKLCKCNSNSCFEGMVYSIFAVILWST